MQMTYVYIQSLLEEGLAIIEQSVKDILEYLDTIGLTLSANKTQLCVFNRNNQILRSQERGSRGPLDQTYKIKIQGKTIKNSKNVKFLGMTFQSDLNWSIHIRNGKTMRFLTENLKMFSADMMGSKFCGLMCFGF